VNPVPKLEEEEERTIAINGVDMLLDVSFKKFECIWSGPGDLVTFNFSRGTHNSYQYERGQQNLLEIYKIKN
jgi:hypothetical protein